ncbi:hypothetical protein HIM_01207 [Hirsutella minnesotensis 3608]|nr:hypothetical protein HIM_01207 [Hirsutella minnesotensis 3608]
MKRRAAVAGAAVGGPLGGVAGAVTDGAIGGGLALATNIAKLRDGKIEAFAREYAYKERVVTPDLMRAVAQDFKTNPAKYAELLKDPVWQDAMESAPQFDAMPHIEALEDRNEDLELQKAFWGKAAVSKYALNTGVGTGLLGSLPHVVEEIIDLFKTPEFHGKIFGEQPPQAAIESASPQKFTAKITKVSSSLDVPVEDGAYPSEAVAKGMPADSTKSSSPPKLLAKITTVSSPLDIPVDDGA